MSTSRVYIKQVNQTLDYQWFHLLVVSPDGAFVVGSPTQQIVDKVSGVLKTASLNDMQIKRSLTRSGLWSTTIECRKGDIVCVNHWQSPLMAGSIPFNNKGWEECQLAQ